MLLTVCCVGYWSGQLQVVEGSAVLPGWSKVESTKCWKNAGTRKYEHRIYLYWSGNGGGFVCFWGVNLDGKCTLMHN